MDGDEVAAPDGLVAFTDVLDALDQRASAGRQYVDKAAESAGWSPAYVEEAEGALLGAILLDGERVLHVCEDERLRADDFYVPRHRMIFEAMLSLAGKSREISAITVVDELNRRAQLEDCGGGFYLSHLQQQTVTAAAAPTHARMIVEKSRLRAVMVSCEQAIGRARLGEQAHDIIDSTAAKLMDIERRSSSTSTVDLKATMRRMMLRLPAMGGVDDSRTTGFVDLDRYMKMRAGDLVILAARPSMGKTQLALDIANHFALDKKEPVIVFSLEMDAEQLMRRQVSSRSRINVEKPRMNAQETMRITDVSAEIAEAPLHIIDTPGMTIGEIRSEARAISRRHGVRLIVVDYIQLATTDRKFDNKATEVGEVSKGLKNLGRELRAPVIALSQLNRAVEQRADRRPVMSDLRDSGAIEQDADVIAFLFREEYYLKDNTPGELRGVSEVIIGKNRNGPTGTVNLHFNSEIPRFDNHADNSRL